MISHEELKQRLSYNELTGAFTWLDSKSNAAPIGSRAGCINKVTGYRQIRLNGETYREHRLAWFWYYGTWPEDQIDHINQIKTDNRICNLRVVSTSGNSQNKASKGCCYDKNMQKWKAYISINNKRTHLGYFDTQEEAIAVYKSNKKILHIKGASND